jgi:TatD DNase family protein
VALRRRTIGRRGLLPDTHAHLDAAEFDGDRDAVVARARAAGVTRILAVATNLASCRTTVSIAAETDSVFAAVGLHPTEASRWEDEADGICAVLDAPNVVAIGEIGLDFVRGAASREKQLTVFRTQLGWAEERGLPVSVHNRGADDDLLRVLGDYSVRVVLHCFSGSLSFAEAALARGYALSFAGNITFPRADVLREVAARVPDDRLLLETDSPVLAPQPWRGRRNEPAYERATLETLASVRSAVPDVLQGILTENADRVFHWGTA